MRRSWWSTSTSLPATSAHPAFLNGYTVGGGNPDNVRVVKIPTVPGDYSTQVAQAISDGTDCIAGGISDSNWAAWLPAMKAAGATQRLYGAAGQPERPDRRGVPRRHRERHRVELVPEHLRRRVGRLPRLAREVRRPDLDWNSLAGLGTWTAYTAFTKIVEGMTGEVDHDTFIDAANTTTALDTGGMIPVLDLPRRHGVRRHPAPHLQPHRVLRRDPRRRADPARRRELRHDRPHRRGTDELTLRCAACVPAGAGGADGEPGRRLGAGPDR